MQIPALHAHSLARPIGHAGHRTPLPERGTRERCVARTTGRHVCPPLAPRTGRPNVKQALLLQQPAQRMRLDHRAGRYRGCGRARRIPTTRESKTDREAPAGERQIPVRYPVPGRGGAALIVIITVVLPPTTWATSQRHPSVPPKMHSRRITSSVKTRLRRSGHASLQWATTNPSSHAFPLILTFPI